MKIQRILPNKAIHFKKTLLAFCLATWSTNIKKKKNVSKNKVIEKSIGEETLKTTELKSITGISLKWIYLPMDIKWLSVSPAKFAAWLNPAIIIITCLRRSLV